MSGERDRSPFMDRFWTLCVVVVSVCMAMLVIACVVSALANSSSWTAWLGLLLVGATSYYYFRTSISLLKALNGGTVMSAAKERGTHVYDVAPELVELTNHLFDGHQLFVPFLNLGKYDADQFAAHGHVGLTLGVDGNLPVAKHPTTGKWATRVEEDGHLFWVAIQQLAHDMECWDCWYRLWLPLEYRSREVHPGRSMFAIAQIGAGRFVVDAEDLS